jgi:predicted transcriptional regulator
LESRDRRASAVESAFPAAIAIAHSAARSMWSRVFPNDSRARRRASSSHRDDAMIRNPSKRMTVAQLKQRMDHRFREVDKRFDEVDKRFDEVEKRFGEVETRLNGRIDRRFESISDKLDSIAKSLDDTLKHHGRIIYEHEKRLTDLEASNRSH